jgi:putative PIN family toxin of toxin-antitoxin system
MRAVVDANVWISALINHAGAPARVLVAFRKDRFTLVLSETLLDELAGVLARPRLALRFGITPAKALDLMAVLRERADLVEVTGTRRLGRDPDDDLKGVSELATILDDCGVAILTVRRFLARLDNERLN